jgi:hypothetical protein
MNRKGKKLTQIKEKNTFESQREGECKEKGFILSKIIF